MNIVKTTQGPAFQDDAGTIILLNGPDALVEIVKTYPEMIPTYVAQLTGDVLKALDLAKTGLESTPLGAVTEGALAEVHDAIRALVLIGYSVEARLIAAQDALEHTHD